MKYRIIKKPVIGQDSIFMIQALGQMIEFRFLLPDKKVDCWMPVDTEGEPIDFSIDLMYRIGEQEMLGSFKTEYVARRHLKMIEAYRNKKVQVVFETES